MDCTVLECIIFYLNFNHNFDKKYKYYIAINILKKYKLDPFISIRKLKKDDYDLLSKILELIIYDML